MVLSSSSDCWGIFNIHTFLFLLPLLICFLKRGKVNQMYLLCISDIPGHIWYPREKIYTHNFLFPHGCLTPFSVKKTFSGRVRHFIKSSPPPWILWEEASSCAPLLVWWVIESPIYHWNICYLLSWHLSNKNLQPTWFLYIAQSISFFILVFSVPKASTYWQVFYLSLPQDSSEG